MPDAMVHYTHTMHLSSEFLPWIPFTARVIKSMEQNGDYKESTNEAVDMQTMKSRRKAVNLHDAKPRLRVNETA